MGYVGRLEGYVIALLRMSTSPHAMPYYYYLHPALLLPSPPPPPPPAASPGGGGSQLQAPSPPELGRVRERNR